MHNAVILLFAIFAIPSFFYLGRHIAKGIVWADRECENWNAKNLSRFR